MTRGIDFILVRALKPPARGALGRRALAARAPTVPALSARLLERLRDAT
jgi:hypothetical protein